MIRIFPKLRVFFTPLCRAYIHPAFQRHNIINDEYQKFRKKYNIPEAKMDAQQKELEEILDQAFENYRTQAKFNEFNQKNFTDLLATVSYSFQNNKLIQSEKFQSFIKEMSDKAYLLTEPEHICIFFQFCAVHNFTDNEIWGSLASLILNNHQQLTPLQKITILDCIYKLQLYKQDQEYESMFSLFENPILEALAKENSGNSALLMGILQSYQDKGSEPFNYTIEQHILKNIPEIQINQLIGILMHYTVLKNYNIEAKKKIINAIQTHITQVITNIDTQQLIKILFCFVRTGLGTEALYKALEKRFVALLNRMTLDQLYQLLVIASNQPLIVEIFFKAAEGAILDSSADIQPKQVVRFFYLYAETGQGSQGFMLFMEGKVYPALYTVTPDEMGELLLAMQSVMKLQVVWIDRFAEMIVKRIDELKTKHLTQIVWMMSDHYKMMVKIGGDTEQLQTMFKKVSYKLMVEFCNFDTVTIKECALVLSAYVQNYPIPANIVDFIYEYLIDEEDLENRMQGWDLSTILWGFQHIDNYTPENVKNLFEKLYYITVNKLEDMTTYEMLVASKAYIMTENERDDSLISKIIELVAEEVDSMNELQQVYLAIFVLMKSKFQGLEGQDDLIEKLLRKAESLKLVVPVQEDELDKQVKEFLLNEELTKYK